MGTDIHPAVEVRRKGVWRYHRPKTECPYYYEYKYEQGQRIYDLDSDGNRIRSRWDRCATRLPEFFGSRNYLKFAILGNVRNGFGFGGVKTFDPLPPMSDQRGYPPDISIEAMAKMSEEHSATWVTLAEMMAYDFSGDLVEEGVIDEIQFLECLIKDTTPTSWSGGISGRDIEVVTPEEYLALYGSKRDMFTKEPLVPRTYDTTKRYFIQYRWTVPLNTSCPDIPEIITYMHDLIPKGGTTEDVRLVMDFDS